MNSSINNVQAVSFYEVETSLKIKVKPQDSQGKININDLLNRLANEYGDKKSPISEFNSSSHQLPELVSESLPVKAQIIVLNKITAQSVKKILHLSEKKFFGNISIEIHRCIKNTDPLNTNNLMLLTILEHKIDDDDDVSIFHGWISSLNPSISTPEHPVYEVIAIDCITSCLNEDKITY